MAAKRNRNSETNAVGRMSELDISGSRSRILGKGKPRPRECQGDNMGVKGGLFWVAYNGETCTDVYYIGSGPWRLGMYVADRRKLEMCTKMRQKQCIIVHVRTRIWAKVHYSAVFAEEMKK